MGIDATVLLDIESFDSPMMPSKDSFTHGSTTVEDIEGSANAAASIALSRYEGYSAAQYFGKYLRSAGYTDADANRHSQH